MKWEKLDRKALKELKSDEMISVPIVVSDLLWLKKNDFKFDIIMLSNISFIDDKKKLIKGWTSLTHEAQCEDIKVSYSKWGMSAHYWEKTLLSRFTHYAIFPLV